MKTTLILLTVVGGLAIASVPASAEDAFIGVPGVAGVEIGSGHHGYRDRDYDRGDRFYGRTTGYDRYNGAERCRTTIIRHSNGMTTKERRCRD
jgi:chorismate synthase